MADVFINDVAYDSSCVTVKLDGVFPVPGFMSVGLGKGLTPGKTVTPMGELGPTKRTRGRFSSDGFSLKVLYGQSSKLHQYLLQKASILGVESISGVQFNISCALEAQPNVVETISLFGCHLYGPDIQGTDSPDSNDPMTAEYSLQPLNRSIRSADGVEIYDWYRNQNAPNY